MIPQSQKLIEICFSPCGILYQSEIYVVVFLDKFEFYIQENEIFFGPKKTSKCVLAFASRYKLAFPRKP